MESTNSKYWLDLVAADIISQHPKGEILVSSGVAPSGSYHVGHFREVLTADSVTKAIIKAGGKARHLHVVDNMDPLRRRYDWLPDDYEQYVGQPICLIPDPKGDCHGSYAEHYFREFEANAHKMGVEMDVVFSYEDQYRPGKMTDAIETVLSKLAAVQKILKDKSGREVEANWTPVQVIGPDKKFINARLDTWDKAAQTIAGVSYTSGQAKLNWRLDWPARWALHGVDVEPFGKELATKGGSYDTGAAFAEAVFGVKPPYPVPYDTINMAGDNKKMSSSLGNLITPAEALEIMPAEILRYFVLRSRPERILYFDSGLGLYNLIEEYSQVEAAVQAGQDHEFKEAYQMASAGRKSRVISAVPFSHMVAVYQAALGDKAEAIKILERTGYEAIVAKERAVIEAEFHYVKNWLAKYAPDKVKFSVQDKLPKVELSTGQKQFLAELAEKIAAEKNLSGQGMHDLIYATTQTAELKPAEAFAAIYRVILGQDSGPKAGWFLASLKSDWLVKRLKLAA